MDNEKNVEEMIDDLTTTETNLSSSDGDKPVKERRKGNIRKNRNDRQMQDKNKSKDNDKDKEKDKEKEGCENKKGNGRPEKKQRIGKKTSSVWDHYTLLPDCDPGKPRAACNYCGTDYAADTKLNGTSTLWAHVERKCKKCHFSDWAEQNKRKQSTLDRFTKKKTTTCNEEEVASSGLPLRFNQNLVRKAIAEYIIVDELPFRHIDGKGFQKLIRLFFDDFQFPSRFTAILAQHRVSLTTDCWTSIQNISYLCLTAHWVDDNWEMQKRIINFIQVPSHKGDLVGKELINCLNEWGISKVFAVTVDNASSNDVALRKLKGNLLEKDNTVPLNGEMFHMRCSAHILNLIVSDGLKELNEAISSIRNAVRYVRSSPARLKRFKESCMDANIESKALLCLDVVTRWNSTYMMLEAAIKFKKAFDNLEGDANYTRYFDEERMVGPPSNLDWEKAGVFVSFLKRFYDLTNRFSGSLYVTPNLFLPDILKVHADLTTMASSPDTLLGTMAISMKRKYDKYWGRIEKLNMLTFIVNILDPRYKLEVVNRGFRFVYNRSEAEKMIKLVTDTLTQLYVFYKQQQTTQPSEAQQSQAQPSQSQSQVSQSQPSESVISATTESFLLGQLQLSDDIEEDDLEYYLNDRREKLDPTFDILQWWKQNGFKYPVVARMAKEVLAVQMSTVASESAFSTGGRILDAFRSSLSPRMVEALICSKNWYTCEYEEPIVLRQYMDEIEGLETCEQVIPGDGSCIINTVENLDNASGSGSGTEKIN
ncbi:hypothetical protein CsatA_015750 [Cannabis sativa]